MLRQQMWGPIDWTRFVSTLVAAIFVAASASAQHIDVTFQENESDGRLSVHGRDFDQLPAFRHVNGKRVFGRSFLLSGNTLVQDDPGFTASAFGPEIDPFFLDPPVPNENLHFQISAAPSFLTELGGRNLSYWDGSGSVSWGPLPAGTDGITISVDRSNSMLPMATADGSTSDIPGFVISASDGAGSIHTHIDFELDPDSGADGVYLMMLEGTFDEYAEWVPFWILFEGFAGGASSVALAISDVETDLLFPLCSDGIDNDRDGNIDFPADGGCTDANDMSERDVIDECDNGLDDDMDGLIDHPNDPDCVTATGTEMPEPGVAVSLLAGGGLVGLLGRRRSQRARGA
ncbi:MAG: hypothetical protein AAF430_03640 [Myxococcota bacterium]